MSWSLRLGSIAGIGIFVHWTFSLIIIFVLLLYLGGGQPVGVALTGVLFVLGVFVCVVLHELGHALWARRYGIHTRDIILLPIGGVARLERMPEKPKEEFLVAMAGPAVNVVIAAILFLLLAAFFIPVGGWERLSDELRVFAGVQEEGVPQNHFAMLMWVNLFLVAFNLLPAFPMD
ncbi:MAG: site-2 protease family protein, partial [Opitutales bacterium]